MKTILKTSARLASHVLGSLLLLSACGADGFDEASGQTDEVEVENVGQEIQNADLIDVSGAVVEILIPTSTGPKGCTATLINENSLITAAHCGAQNSSYWPSNVKVLYQENSTTWRCLTNLNASGNPIRGSHNTVVSGCAGRTAGFGSMFDYGTDNITFSGDDPGETWQVPRHDFAVVKVWDNGFTWVGTNSGNYAALWTGAISNGWEWAYGTGFSSTTNIDFRVRRDQYNVVYSDNFVVGAFGSQAQLCSGDSGGPLGVFLPQTGKFAVVAVANVIPENVAAPAPSTTICGTVNGSTYWSNASTRVWYVESAIGKTCRIANHGGINVKECW